MCLRDAAMDSLASLLIWLLFMWHWRLSLCFHPLGFGSCKTWKESMQYILLLPFGSCLLVHIDPQEHQKSMKSNLEYLFHVMWALWAYSKVILNIIALVLIYIFVKFCRKSRRSTNIILTPISLCMFVVNVVLLSIYVKTQDCTTFNI